MKKLFILLNLLVLSATVNGFAEDKDKNDNPYATQHNTVEISEAGIPWNEQRHALLIEEVEKQAPSEKVVLTYPLSEADLNKIYQSASTVPFFAYSSLIDNESAAAKAISAEGVATSKPAVGFGIQRVFNRQMAPETAAHFGALRRPNDVAILNVFEMQEAALNGALLDLSQKDLLILAGREVGYNLVSVPVMMWDEAVDKNKSAPKVIAAYTFMAPDYQGEGTRYTNDKINPIPDYVANLLKGLKKHGQGFEAMWWTTTYLADKETPISEMVHEEIDLDSKED